MRTLLGIGFDFRQQRGHGSHTCGSISASHAHSLVMSMSVALPFTGTDTHHLTFGLADKAPFFLPFANHMNGKLRVRMFLPH